MGVGMNERINELALRCGVDSGQIIANVICGGTEFSSIGIEFNKLSQHTRDSIRNTLEYAQERFVNSLIEKICYDLMNVHGASPDHIAFIAKVYGVEL